MLTSRRIEVLECIVEDFIQTADPVGSKTLVNKYKLPYSSATIRNDMVILEEMGYIEKTHTSSGRVPSIKGYKYYCEYLLDNNKEIQELTQFKIMSVFSDKTLNVNEAIRQSCDIISEMTNLASGVLGPDARMQKLEHIKIFPIDKQTCVCVFITDVGHTENRTFKFKAEVTAKDIQKCTDILNDRLKGTPIDQVVIKMQSIKPILADTVIKHEILFNAFIGAFVKFASDNVYFSGTQNMLYQPEFSDIDKLKEIMSMMENTKMWREIGNDEHELIIHNEHGSEMLWKNDLAIVKNSFKVGNDESGQIMVVGPPRMDYDRIVGLLEYVCDSIEKLYGNGDKND
jgi:heat-inducible transcriptional repressor